MSRTGLIVTLLALSATPALAGGSWAKDVSFEPASRTTLKVVEPDGFKVRVVPAEGEPQEDTVPAAFAFANQGAFVTLTMTASDGETWNTKVELKERQVTVVKVKYQAPKNDKDKPADVVKYIGKAENITNLCAEQDRGDIRLEWKLKGKQVLLIDVPVNTYYPNIELETGRYDVRVYQDLGQGFMYKTTSQFDVANDGWLYYYGCKQN